MSAIEKYLAQYAEKDCLLLVDFPVDAVFEHCIALPVYDESLDCVIRIEGHNAASTTLLIVVLNQSTEEQQVKENNHAFRWLLNMNSRVLWRNAHATLFAFGKLNVLLLERFQAALCLKPEEGVGRARKLAGDLALTLFQRKQIQSEWLYSTDADALLPQNYFYKPPELAASAMVFEFEHIGEQEDEVFAATQLYENGIQYFRDALAWAGSPYAYCSLGSALAVNFEAYAQARGFPARSGGEDFYLLNKLAKLGGVHVNTEVLIQIQARLSQRVPFGTGPAVNKILNLQALKQAYCYYDPEIFVVLKTLLGNLEQLFTYRIQNQQPYPDADIEDTLNHLKISRFCDHCLKQNIHLQDFAKHFHIWFDAFQTLKFIHSLRDGPYPDQPLASCLTRFNELNKES